MVLNQQYALAAWKTNSILSCSKRDVTVPTYSALPRPQVEYCIQAWDPKLKKDVRVQRRAIEIIRRTLLQRQTGAGLAQPEECFRETLVWCSSTWRELTSRRGTNFLHGPSVTEQGGMVLNWKCDLDEMSRGKLSTERVVRPWHSCTGGSRGQAGWSPG